MKERILRDFFHCHGREQATITVADERMPRFSPRCGVELEAHFHLFYDYDRFAVSTIDSFQEFCAHLRANRVYGSCE